MRPLRPATQAEADAAAATITALRVARDYARKAGSPRTLDLILRALKSAEGAQRHVAHRLHRTAAPPLADVPPASYNTRPGGQTTMSRREIPIKVGERRAVRAVVGYDRPLETYFAQVFETDADGEEDAFLWQGTFPGELPTPRSAIALIEPFCDVPADLAAALETDQLKTLAQQDSPGQAEAKRLLIRGESAQPRPNEPKD
ncbi:hypothetical protein [Porphyrobacter sp. GA68]|uniref:hypothetical protein n=1 Tax=Porphyrobacter sp. GA68 TaxID=2883480 RepID=UPI001D189C0A|nr:hypothetical protein [Porphyrobacter sp. GA68]